MNNSRIQPTKGMCGYTCNFDVSAEVFELIRATNAYKAQRGISVLTDLDYLAIAKSCGWTKCKPKRKPKN